VGRSKINFYRGPLDVSGGDVPVPGGEGEAEAGNDENDENNDDAGQVDRVQVQPPSSCKCAFRVIIK
jgi:hypothetical protein